MRNLWIAAFCIFVCACTKDANKPGLVDAYVPIYGNLATIKTFSQLPSRPIVKGGKIAVIGSYLFQVEDGSGIHVINISDPAVPQKISFLNIPLCNEVTLKGNYLYTNNADDLLVLNFSNINSITLSSRLANAFPNTELQYPPQTGVYFECPDPASGPVIGWELKQVNNPKCKR
jgi:hypothetical protein